MSEDLNLARTAVSPRRMLVPSPHPARERAEKEPLLSTGLFRNRTSNPGLVTQKTGTILVSDLASGNQSYALAMASLTAIGLLGLVAAMWLPSNPVPQQT